MIQPRRSPRFKTLATHRKQGQTPPNLLTLRPKPLVQWTVGQDDKVVLLVPKFRRGPLARWLMARLSKPWIHVNLDAYGSLLWRQCDGNKSVADIALAMQETFGGAPESYYERINIFLRQLERGDLITCAPPTDL